MNDFPLYPQDITFSSEKQPFQTLGDFQNPSPRNFEQQNFGQSSQPNFEQPNNFEQPHFEQPNSQNMFEKLANNIKNSPFLASLLSGGSMPNLFAGENLAKALSSNMPDAQKEIFAQVMANLNKNNLSKSQKDSKNAENDAENQKNTQILEEF